MTAPLVHPQWDPIAIHITQGFGVHWYGLMYLVGFAGFLMLARWRIRQPQLGFGHWTPHDLDDFLFLGVLGVVLGGRLGYAFFYKPDYYLSHPLEILQVWKGGMAFHGGLLGVMVAAWWFARSRQRPFLEVADVIAPCVGLGFGAVRFANFINGELWGRAADPSLPWAMVFPQAFDGLARHPSQLYQMLGEGGLMFGLLWWYARRPRGLGQVAGVFLLLYGAQRFAIEFFREPDVFLGLRWLSLSQGQWLCVPMIAAGVWLWAQGRNSHRAGLGGKA
jgi:phosphatidylglycerol:prolipoprotein diacylglycerol transferase